MHILIRCSGIGTPDALQDYVLRRLEFSLKRFEHDVEQVTVHLAGAGDAEVSSDRTCHIVAELYGGTIFSVEERQMHFSSAVDLALKRITFNITNSLTVQRDAIDSALRAPE
jgi:ribosome-associated translation inhibitor RaiA